MSGELIKQFEEYLRMKKIVKEKSIPYYINHLYRFKDFSGKHRELTIRDRIAHFAEHLQSLADLEDWQRRQGLDAVQMYIYTFLPSLTRTEQEKSNLNASYQQVLDRMQQSLEVLQYPDTTRNTYMGWLKRYLKYCGETNQDHRENDAVKNYMAHLAIKEEVAAKTQNQSFYALLFFFRHVLEKDLTDMAKNVRAKEKETLPVIFTEEEMLRILSLATGKDKLLMSVIYGGGLRINEGTRLRVQDIDFEQNLLTIRDAKGKKDRITLLSEKVAPDLKVHLVKMKKQHEEDLKAGFGEVALPNALSRKYPKAAKEWGWQWAFPSTKISLDKKSGKEMRYHVRAATIRRELKKLMDELEIYKHCTPHTFRHSFGTHLMLQGVDIRTVQELMGHKSVETTMIYTRLVKQLSPKPKSPLDKL